MFGIHRNFPVVGGGDTSDATANQWNITNGLTAYIASGKVTGNAYTPAMMKYNGSSGYYGSNAATSSGNKATFLARFKRASFGGGGVECVGGWRGPTGKTRVVFYLFSNDHATTENRGKLCAQVTNSSSTTICLLISSSVVTDDELHTALFSFDGDSGVATFYVDGSDEDDTGNSNRVSPTTGTLESGANSLFSVGSASWNSTSNLTSAEIGFVIVRDAYLTNWSDFMQADGSPKNLDTSGWTELGGQPLFYNPHGDMVNNLGSGGAMTKNGTINVGDGGS